MTLNNTFDSQDFDITMVDGIPVLKFNMLRATLRETADFKQHLTYIISNKHKFIIIDFSECLYIDSAIVGVMVTHVKDLRKNSGDILIVVPIGVVNNLFSQTGLDRIFKVFQNLSAALDNFNPTNEAP